MRRKPISLALTWIAALAVAGSVHAGTVTGTVKYEVSPGFHRLAGVFEVRHDRSTGDEGGFFEGPENRLVPNQNLVLLGLLWSFDR